MPNVHASCQQLKRPEKRGKSGRILWISGCLWKTLFSACTTFKRQECRKLCLNSHKLHNLEICVWWTCWDLSTTTKGPNGQKDFYSFADGWLFYVLLVLLSPIGPSISIFKSCFLYLVRVSVSLHPFHGFHSLPLNKHNIILVLRVISKKILK